MDEFTKEVNDVLKMQLFNGSVFVVWKREWDSPAVRITSGVEIEEQGTVEQTTSEEVSIIDP